MILRWDFRTVSSRRTKAIAGLALVCCVAGGVGACAADAQEASKIAFVSDRDGNQEIYLINPDGSGLTNLTQHPEKDFAPSWSPDGSRIAFRSHRGDGYYNLYLMDADGSNPTRLVTNAADDGSGDYTPHWSPDGTKILFDSTRDDAYAAYGSSYVVNVDGSSLTNLALESGLRFAKKASWSPDGSKIVCESEDDIYVMNPDGTDPAKLVEGMRPSWSPDGSKIAFIDSRRSDIYAMDGNGSNRLRLTDTSAEVFVGVPSWSPEGSKLAFSTMSVDGFSVAVIEADGSNLRIVADQIPVDLQLQFPISWSPDGTRLVVMRMDKPWAEVQDALRRHADEVAEIDFDSVSDILKVDVYILDADGSGLTRLTDSGLNEDPVWSPANK